MQNHVGMPSINIIYSSNEAPVVLGDVPGLVQDAIELGFLPQDVDKSTLTPVLQKVFDSAQLAVSDQVKSGLTYKAIQVG